MWRFLGRLVLLAAVIILGLHWVMMLAVHVWSLADNPLSTSYFTLFVASLLLIGGLVFLPASIALLVDATGSDQKARMRELGQRHKWWKRPLSLAYWDDYWRILAPYTPIWARRAVLFLQLYAAVVSMIAVALMFLVIHKDDQAWRTYLVLETTSIFLSSYWYIGAMLFSKWREAGEPSPEVSAPTLS